MATVKRLVLVGVSARIAVVFAYGGAPDGELETQLEQPLPAAALPPSALTSIVEALKARTGETVTVGVPDVSQAVQS